MQIGICDDEKEIRELLTAKVKACYPAGNTISYESGQAVLQALRLPNILFLDIKMSGMNGVETAKELRRIDKQLIIIFVTAIEEYVFQAFDVGAFHYLVKPFTDEKFAEVLQNAVKQVEDRRPESANTKKEVPNLVINAKGEHIVVNPEDIVYAEVFDWKMVIHTMESDIEYYGKMKELEKKTGDDFYRLHRAYLVNFNFIRKYDAETIYLEKGQALVAKKNYQDFVKCYLRYNLRKGKE